MRPQHHQPAAADPAEAAAPAAALKPIMDRIDAKLSEILQEITALKEIAGAPPRQRTSPPALTGDTQTAAATEAAAPALGIAQPGAPAKFM
jgi:uncharacterized coiled-coil protein SlyX